MTEILTAFNGLPIAGQMASGAFQLIMWVLFLTVNVANARERAEPLVKMAWAGGLLGVFLLLQSLWVGAVIDMGIPD